MFDNLSFDLTANEWMAVGIVFCFGFLMLWYLLSAGSIRIGIWHVAFMALASFCIGSALQEYTLLLDWVEFGLTFTNLGASMFVVGMISMIVVMVWNLIASGGRTLVR